MMELGQLLAVLEERVGAMDRFVGEGPASVAPSAPPGERVVGSIYMVVDMLATIVRKQALQIADVNDQLRAVRLEGRQDLLGQAVAEKRNHKPEIYGISAGDIVRDKATGEPYRLVPVDALIDQPEPDVIDEVNANLHLGNGQAITWNGPAIKGDDGVWRIELCAPAENNAPAPGQP